MPGISMMEEGDSFICAPDGKVWEFSRKPSGQGCTLVTMKVDHANGCQVVCSFEYPTIVGMTDEEVIRFISEAIEK